MPNNPGPPQMPFPQRPLLWGVPVNPDYVDPGTPGGQATLTLPQAGTETAGSTIVNQTFSFFYNNGSVSQSWPKFQRMVRLKLPDTIGLLAVSLSTSLLSPVGSSTPLAVCIAFDTGPIIDITSSSSIYVDHEVVPSLSQSMRSGIAYADEVAPKIASGQAISLYLSTNNGGDNAIGVATLRYFIAAS